MVGSIGVIVVINKDFLCGDGLVSYDRQHLYSYMFLYIDII